VLEGLLEQDDTADIVVQAYAHEATAK
jgi:hypothetical protein